MNIQSTLSSGVNSLSSGVSDIVDRIPQPISRTMHAAADYAYIPTLAAAPSLFGFADNKLASRLAQIMAGGILVQSLMTKAEWGAVKVLPFKRHLQMDLATGLFAAGAPWLFGFAKNKRARNTFVVMGLVSLVAGALSRKEDFPTVSELANNI